MTTILTGNRVGQGVIVAVAAFTVLGTVSALWDNPLFVRMAPIGGAEISLLAILAMMSGTFVTVRRPVCAAKTAGAVGIFGYLGIACPVCNKILLFAFGSEILLSYYEPVRIYVTVLGIIIMAWLVWREIRIGRDLLLVER